MSKVMPQAPTNENTPLLRTDFSDEVVWEQLLEAVAKPSGDGFIACLHIISDQEFEGADPEALGHSYHGKNHAIVFIADKETMTHPERPILCVSISAPDQTFRVIPDELWSPENNLSLANMDFHEFANNVGSDGIFRGF